MNLLGHRILHRSSTGMGGTGCTERTSADFLIDGKSLLEALVEATGGHSDFMGSFVRGYGDECRRVSSMLLNAPESGARVLLYICPECGDVGCGAYSALVRRNRDAYVWEEFAYQTSEVELTLIEALGPFTFDARLYQAALLDATRFDDIE